MAKYLSAFGFFAGFGLLALAYINPQSVTALQAREDSPSMCRMTEVALDEGYGISRVETREVCAK